MTSNTSSSNEGKKTAPLYIPRTASVVLLSLAACGALMLLTSWAYAGVLGSGEATPAIAEAYSNNFLATDKEVKPATPVAKAENVSVLNDWQFTGLHASRSR